MNGRTCPVTLSMPCVPSCCPSLPARLCRGQRHCCQANASSDRAADRRRRREERRQQGAASHQQYDASTNHAQILSGKQAGQVVRDGLKSLQSRLPSLEAAVGLSAIALVYIPFPSWQPASHDQPLGSLNALLAGSADALAAAGPSLRGAVLGLCGLWLLLGLTRRMDRQDQAAASLGALCAKNAELLQQYTMLLDPLESHPAFGEAASKLRRDSLNQLVLQQVLLAQLDTSATYSAEEQLHQAVCEAAEDLGRQDISVESAIKALQPVHIPKDSLGERVAQYDKVLALMLIRQRNMRITVTSFVEEMARVVPPLRRQLALTRRDFRQRFLAEEEMLNALTPPGFDAAARLRQALQADQARSRLQANGLNPTQMYESLVGPYGWSPILEKAKLKLERNMFWQTADGPELRKSKQELEHMFRKEMQDLTDSGSQQDSQSSSDDPQPPSGKGAAS